MSAIRLLLSRLGRSPISTTPLKSGRAIPGVPGTFTSVTQLQYDRLTKWANGEFSVGHPLPIHHRFEDIPLRLQPEALTKASLEPTIGSPLYPGIEMSWNAEIPDNYEFDSPFTMADKLLAGDLTKYLSLPWQSDFVSLNTTIVSSLHTLTVVLCSTCVGMSGFTFSV